MVSTYCDALMEKLTPLLAAASDRPVLVGLDGCCGSGKTTLAGQLAQRLPECTVLHTDDYYLPLDRRTPDWMHTPAANMDLTRLADRSAGPCPGRAALYSPGLQLPSGAVSAPGGAYPWGGGIGRGQLLPSSVPGGLLRPAHLFAVQPGGTGPRLQAREGERYPLFVQRWIPLEEGYFARYSIPERADWVLTTG